MWCHQKSFLCVPLYSFLARCHKIFLLIIGIIGTRYGVFQCTVSFFGNVQSMAIFSSALFARLGVLYNTPPIGRVMMVEGSVVVARSKVLVALSVGCLLQMLSHSLVHFMHGLASGQCCWWQFHNL